ncbi:MAG: hypothetical protein EA359_03025 [Balneolaceae bacterium]|nr:MAG: hypothetical protein EA359_03025 [Balneolaceae bacterium]
MLNRRNPDISAREFVLNFFEGDTQTTPQLTDILIAGLRKGYHRKDLWRQIVSLSADTAIQRKWSHWAAVNDREEIRLRLKVLRETDILDDSLVEFVLFFFRASDPVLYQLSAIVVGREMENHPALKEYLLRYCKHRNISLDEPVRLNNQRSRRRVLLVMASRLANDSDGRSFPFPVDMSTSADLIDADISILFLSCSLILEGGWPDCSEYAASLFNDRFTMKRHIRDRSLVRNAGILMEHLKQYGKHAGDLFHLCFDHVLDQYNQAGHLATRLQALFLLDELMESSMHLGLEFKGAGSGSTRQGRFNRFLEIRLRHWAYSVQKSYEPHEDVETSGRDSITDILHSSNIHEEPEEQYRVFAETVHRLADEGSWRTFTVEERCYRAFFLIDFSIHSASFDPEEIILLFQSNGMTERAEQSELSQKRTQSQSLLSPIMKRLLELEPSLSRHLFDPQLIHRLADFELLPALIPTGADPDFLSILADAVEHQFRLQLAVNPAFNPDHYLYLLTIRRPSARFYRNLLELCSGREYKRINGEAYPLYTLTEELLKEITSDPGNYIPPHTPFWDGLNHIRNKLTEMAGESNLLNLLAGLETEMHGTGAEQLREGITLHDLLEIVQPPDAVWHRAGEPSFTMQSGKQIIERDEQLAEKLKSKTMLLAPATLHSGFIVGEAVQSIEYLLEQMGDTLLPLLGVTEARLFERVLEAASIRLREWSGAFSEAARIWSGRKTENSDTIPGTLFELINKTENRYVREKLFGIVMDTLTQECHNSGDSWLNRYHLLRKTAKTGSKHDAAGQVSESRNERFAGLWKELALEAMEKKAEARVVQLVKEKEFESIRRRDDVREVLGEIKQWCFGRYDFHHALLCNREINPTKIPFTGILKTAGEYAGYFARVWIALLAGVIFMFDFGDAWTELAEIGDVGGVIFAFGFGVAGTFLYVWIDLRKKTEHIMGDPFVWVSTIGRVGLFLMITFLYTVLVVCLFWYMFSNTDQVVHGEYAPLHLLSWTGFALFVGVFLGLIGRD